MWQAYVINLSPNVARLENSARQLDRIGVPWRRIDAVYGKQLSPDQIDRVYDKKLNRLYGRRPLVPSEIGCYLSHMSAWRSIAEGNAPGGFVFEDDFLADDTLSEKLQILSEPQDFWDMVKLFSFNPTPKTVLETPAGPYKVVIPYRVPTCLVAYGITRSAATHLLTNAVPFFRAVDEDQKFLWEAKLRIGLMLPTPITIGDQQTVTGTIGNERRGFESGRTLAHQVLHGLRYQVSYEWNLWKYRRKNEL